MHDCEKAIKGLKCIKGDLVLCVDCAYSDDNGNGGYHCKAFCANDAIALLKELQSQIETLEYKLAVAENNLNHYINGND